MDELIPEEDWNGFVTGQDDLLSAPERNTCPDCAVLPGEEHDEGCDVARCLHNGMQRLMCGGIGAADFLLAMSVGQSRPVAHDCGQDIWTGTWPGQMECEEYGWYTITDGRGGMIHVHDLNRLAIECRWDRDARRWVR